MRVPPSAFLVLCLSCALPLHMLAASGETTPLDSDGDNLADSVEDVNNNGRMDSKETDLFNADTDGGGEADGSEIAASRDPLDRKDDFTYDLDNDGLINGEEWVLGTNPDRPDTDGDGLNDLDDPFPLNASYHSDENGDGIPDEYTASSGGANTVMDPQADDDHDGLSNKDEFTLDTDPAAGDTDLDGILDSAEVELGTNPRVNSCLAYADAVAAFADLRGHWAHDLVSTLHRTTAADDLRIVEGYGSGAERMFLPDRPVSRFELVKLALVSSCTPLQDLSAEPSRIFVDLAAVPEQDEPAEQTFRRNVIYTAMASGILQGYDDGTVRADTPVNRAEALKILLKSAHVELQSSEESVLHFPDVPQDSWFSPFVLTAQALSAVEGYEDGTFRPGSFITRAEAAKLILFFLHANPLINGDAIPELNNEESKKTEGGSSDSSVSPASSDSSVSSSPSSP